MPLHAASGCLPFIKPSCRSRNEKADMCQLSPVMSTVRAKFYFCQVAHDDAEKADRIEGL